MIFSLPLKLDQNMSAAGKEAVHTSVQSYSSRDKRSFSPLDNTDKMDVSRMHVVFIWLAFLSVI